MGRLSYWGLLPWGGLRTVSTLLRELFGVMRTVLGRTRRL